MICFTGASQNYYNHIEVIRKTIVEKLFWPHLIKQLLKHDESFIYSQQSLGKNSYCITGNFCGNLISAVFCGQLQTAEIKIAEYYVK
jgi:hypothetical protein